MKKITLLFVLIFTLNNAFATNHVKEDNLQKTIIGNTKEATANNHSKLIAGSFYGEDLSEGDLISLKNLKFKKGYRYLTPESKDVLKELAEFLVQRTDIYFTINGHVCCTSGGMDAKNKETGIANLSVVRAKYIRDYLVKYGVDAKRVRYRGLAGKYNLEEEGRVDLFIRRVADVLYY
ncbi:OmpA family protein [Hwangdonia lutea]|uniref:OmpA family protein n=1 Tax=Hwangdonia lutea TaxID=3075823 RepID=A0AA97EQU8_9FLAO|nr:OmpA family protein [Hwangdonia sp. SCSIO 19198]WOD45004.1 OmpA family protein [Hwangdonia sp. SCSIO 19198]